ncbi:MAG TPA: pyridoxal phosphate-dependent aminotransferase [Candidatus Marinimicrobia bacterium]|nr:pyridoxal phosphate-dependent aminotransferase [Candidatus Neomarinimicrobiota bacterium]
MPISKKIANSISRSSWIRKMFETGIVLKRQYGAANVYDFSLGNPDLPSPPELNKILVEEACRSGAFVHGYMPNAGYVETRQAVADMLSRDSGLPFTKENIVMTCGAAGAINVFLKSVLDPGDEVVVIAPYFTEYNFYIENHGGAIIISDTNGELLPDLADLGKKIGKKTKVVVINSPNNPSGRVYSERLLKQIGDLLQQKSRRYGHPIYLLADEPYKKIIYDESAYHSPLKYYRNTILATSFSKDLSLAGERIGFLAVSPLIEDNKDIINAATFCNRILGFINANALMQRVVKHVLDAGVDVAVYKQRRDFLYSALVDIGYDVIKPEGTFYMFPRSPIPDDVAFVKALQGKMILTTPGTGFHRPGYFRIAFCVGDEFIKGSIKGFETVFKEIRA